MNDIGYLLAGAAVCLLIGGFLLTTQRRRPEPIEEDPHERGLSARPENPEEEARRRQC